ncbi:MAG TPA: hypothetical protein PKY96_08235, partial [Flavobacteriales bacterium]|nr:hypothetical protein [Flavobacteriales bacterium]
DIARTLTGGAMQSARFMLTWLISPALLLVSLLWLANLRSWMQASPWLSERLPRPWPIAIVLVLLLFMCMALPYWASGLLGQHRTVNATLLVLLPGWLLLLASIRIEWIRRRHWPAMKESLQLAAFGLLLIACVTTGSGGRITTDLLSGRLARFDAQMRQRYAAIEESAANHERLLEWPALNDPPRSLRYLDATPDPEHWINRSVTNYLGADSLRISVR